MNANYILSTLSEYVSCTCLSNVCIFAVLSNFMIFERREFKNGIYQWCCRRYYFFIRSNYSVHPMIKNDNKCQGLYLKILVGVIFVITIIISCFCLCIVVIIFLTWYFLTWCNIQFSLCLFTRVPDWMLSIVFQSHGLSVFHTCWSESCF